MRTDALIDSILAEARDPLPITVRTVDGLPVVVSRVGRVVQIGDLRFDRVSALDLSALLARAATETTGGRCG